MMDRTRTLAAILATSIALSSCAPLPVPAERQTALAVEDDAAMQALLGFLQDHRTTGFLVIRDGRTIVAQNWPAPTDPTFANFVYGTTGDGQLLEDVASQQKSFVSVLLGQAADRGLVDVNRPVSDYLGTGWSHAERSQESAIRVIDVLTMSSGLDDSFAYVAPPGTVFHYNTPVYAITKRLLEKATDRPIADLTRDWLTQPLGMSDTAWRQRPAALAGVGNATGLVTTPRDIGKFGAMILAGGQTVDGQQILSSGALRVMLAPSRTNPAYGRLWWLNGSAWTVGVNGARRDGSLIASAPADTVAALGLLDRKLYVVPSLKLIVVRTGAAPGDASFDEHLWQYLDAALGIPDRSAGTQR